MGTLKDQYYLCSQFYFFEFLSDYLFRTKLGFVFSLVTARAHFAHT